MKDVVKFLFETGILSKTPRSGFHFLGSGNQSVAEHLFRTAMVGYSLASMLEGVDVDKVVKMCLVHDLSEGRVSDLNYVHQKYVERNETKAVQDITQQLPFGKDLQNLIEEYEKRETKEAKLAKDSDNIEWILSLKEQVDNGNTKALEWIESAIKRLKTDIAKEIAKEILKTDSDEWWFEDKKGDWWINRNGKK